MNNVISVSEVKAALINHLHKENSWNTRVKNRIIRVIHGYGKRDGLLDQIGGIIYRIWNAIKSLFGQSDWQQAKKAISNQQNLLGNPQVRVLLASDLSDNLRRTCKRIESETGNALLSAYVEATHFQVSSSAEAEKKLSEQLIFETNSRLDKVNQGTSNTNLGFIKI